MLDFLNGKKTYTSLAVLAITMATGVDISEGDVNIVLGDVQSIIAAVASIAAVIGRAVAKP